MFPGLTTKLSEETLASAASINPKADLVKVTGSTAIATIIPNFGGGFSGAVVLVPKDGSVATLTTGNIAAAVTMLQNRATLLVYSKVDDKFYPGAIS
jgi:hypothetical protein